ncbi:rhodanese-like domain-containing protein [Pontibacter vulgaris]|uniref:rhodanese-like domain-containing protein n=1 Tax=Pontibacter vulgaris TaxID=2905679 RepID=UPI001FA6E22E|nr:rhodanese-like domain-containing protein [Pontibacter vulgaris]
MKTVFAAVAVITLMSCSAPQQQGTAEVKRLSATEYKDQHANEKKAVLVDVRTPQEYAAGHVTNAKNSDFLSGQFATEMKGWDKNKTYYLYCASGNRSGKAAKLMQEAGFKKVYNIGGFKDLKNTGLPTADSTQQK